MNSPVKNFRLELDERLCHSCGICVGACAFNALYLAGARLEITFDACRYCRWCLRICPFHALKEAPNLLTEAA